MSEPDQTVEGTEVTVPAGTEVTLPEATLVTMADQLEQPVEPDTFEESDEDPDFKAEETEPKG